MRVDRSARMPGRVPCVVIASSHAHTRVAPSEDVCRFFGGTKKNHLVIGVEGSVGWVGRTEMPTLPGAGAGAKKRGFKLDQPWRPKSKVWYQWRALVSLAHKDMPLEVRGSMMGRVIETSVLSTRSSIDTSYK